jgi:glycosidase
MYFTSNHDEEGSGTSYERLQKASNAWTVLTFTLPGMPLIYSGQETGNNFKQSADNPQSIKFPNHDLSDFYTYLTRLKRENPALWNGSAGGDYLRLKNGEDNHVISFLRTTEGNRLVTIINFSDSLRSIQLNSAKLDGKFSDVFRENYSVPDLNGKQFLLMPYEYRIFSAKE